MSELKTTHDQYIMKTYGRFDLALVKGSGATCQDEEGRQYIDFTSGIGVNSLGFCPAEWQVAVSTQAAKLQHTSNLYYTQPAAQLAKTLCTASGYSKVFFANSGAEANEGAIKLARKYSFDKYGLGRSGIITLNNSFHGRTVTTLAATAQDVFHNYFYPFTPGFSYADADDLQGIKKLAKEGICAVMIELVQGEGGVMSLKQDFVSGLAQFCKAKDILLIADEVQTGIGRTGKLLASQHYGITPNITTLAKGLGGGLPIGAVLADHLCADVLQVGQHATTFGANPIVCAGANAILGVVLSEGFFDEVNKKAEFLRSELAKIPQIKSLTGIGLMVGIELAEGSRPAVEYIKECINKGLLILSAKQKLRLLPPLNISFDDIVAGVNILKAVLQSAII